MVSFAAGVGVFVMTAYAAHHSLSGVYDSSRQANIGGLITQFHFVNPHAYMTVEVRSGSVTQLWRLEMDNRRELVDIGITSETFKAGDRIIASGNQARPEQQLGLYIRRLDRLADGLRYEQIGGSPRIHVPRR
jgi:hypothetical protein